MTKPKRRPKANKVAPRKPPVTVKPVTEPELHGVCLSVSQAGDEFGHDRATIRKRIRELNLQPVAERNGYAVYRLRDLLRMERTTEEGEIDPDKMNPFERSAHYKAESERLKVDQTRGVLMMAESHREEVSRILKVCGQELDILCDEVERDVGCSPLVLEKIEAKIDLARQRMHDGINAAEPEQVEAVEADDA